jgi:hypothetical protein
MWKKNNQQFQSKVILASVGISIHPPFPIIIYSLETLHFTKPVDHRATNNFLNKIKTSILPGRTSTKEKEKEKIKKKTRGIINGNH